MKERTPAEREELVAGARTARATAPAPATHLRQRAAAASHRSACFWHFALRARPRLSGPPPPTPHPACRISTARSAGRTTPSPTRSTWTTGRRRWVHWAGREDSGGGRCSSGCGSSARGGHQRHATFTAQRCCRPAGERFGSGADEAAAGPVTLLLDTGTAAPRRSDDSAGGALPPPTTAAEGWVGMLCVCVTLVVTIHETDSRDLQGPSERSLRQSSNRRPKGRPQDGIGMLSKAPLASLRLATAVPSSHVLPTCNQQPFASWQRTNGRERSIIHDFRRTRLRAASQPC